MVLFQVIEDLRDECAKHGTVTAVTVPRPADKAQAAALFGTANIGKVGATCLNSAVSRCLCHFSSCDACWPPAQTAQAVARAARLLIKPPSYLSLPLGRMFQSAGVRS
jgi:hypothetical protein